MFLNGFVPSSLGAISLPESPSIWIVVGFSTGVGVGVGVGVGFGFGSSFNLYK